MDQPLNQRSFSYHISFSHKAVEIAVSGHWWFSRWFWNKSNPSLLSNWLIALGFEGGELLGTLHEFKKKLAWAPQAGNLWDGRKNEGKKKGKKTSFLTCAYLFIWLYWVLVATRGIWDPSSPTRDRTWISCTEGWILNHWTTREVSDLYPFRIKSLHGPLNFCGSSFPGFRLLLSYFSPKLENTAVISLLNHRYGICVTQFLKVKVFSCSVVSDFFVTPWIVVHQTSLFMEFSRPNTGVGGYSRLQGILSTQGQNPGVLHCKQILYHLSHQGRPLSFWGGCQMQSAHSTLSPRWYFRFVDRTASMPFHPNLRAWLQKYVCTKKLSFLPGSHRLDKIIQ